MPRHEPEIIGQRTQQIAEILLPLDIGEMLYILGFLAGKVLTDVPDDKRAAATGALAQAIEAGRR
ncbi:hypothetical protein [Roseomonas sp. USHLN139]|uniref:hypothetical protein n=1 Tax=Roseomonas sp. USHLN139 TaxID=3081298 RepID=UPI003B029093